MSFEGKVAIVTGSSSGIGAATAVEFAKKGADVVLIGRNQKKLDNVAAVCKENGKKPLIINADVANEDHAERIINETIEKYGKIDILVNNAGIWRPASIESENIMQVFDEVMGVNFRAMLHITHLAVPHLKKTQGNIINISSVEALRTPTTELGVTYNVSKAAVDHFTRCTALDLSRYKVRVNSINPGPVVTDLPETMGLSQEYTDIFWNNLKPQTALDRVSEPKEIADLVLFLASDKSVAITGTTITSDNGMLLKHSEPAERVSLKS